MTRYYIVISGVANADSESEAIDKVMDSIREFPHERESELDAVWESLDAEAREA